MLSIINADFYKNKYSIFISDNVSDSLQSFLKTYKYQSIIVIADSVFKDKNFIPDEKLKNIIYNYNTIFVDGGLNSKSFYQLEKTIDFMVEKKIPRDGLIVAIGGGVIGDLAGLVSSMYHRGIDLCHIPTTMTAVVDSSVGGKTGINKSKIVNLIGTYHHPKAIFIDLRFLNTLHTRDYFSGIAEVVKKSIVKDKSFFDYLLENSKEIKNKKLEILNNIVKKSLEIKLNLTSQDTYEKNNRMLLNYGHTFGQAIESAFDLNHNILRHGEAVSLGMICASSLSGIIYNQGNLVSLHNKILQEFELPISISQIDENFKDIDKIYSLINNDKKRTSESSRFVIIKKIGSGEIISENNKDIIKKSISEIF